MRFTVADFLRTQWTAIPPVLPAALTGKVVVIVGANTGIGYETAKHVALKRPQRLILACRSKDKGESALRAIMAETGCATARLMLVDLASFVSVKHFAQALSAEESKVDFLVYNAGIFNLHYEATPDGWESSLQVNYLSAVYLVTLLLPLLVSGGTTPPSPARVTILGSEAYYNSAIPDDLLSSPSILHRLSERSYCSSSVMRERYGLSKLLAHMFVRRLVVQDLIAPRVTAFTVIPGTCNSSLFRNLPAPFSWIWFLLMLVFARTPEQGARVVVNALLDGRDPSDLGSAVVNNGQLTADSDFLLSARGRELEGQVWAEVLDILGEVDREFRDLCQGNSLTARI